MVYRLFAYCNGINCDDVIINGGVVTAIGGTGGGTGILCDHFTINGGSVYAAGGPGYYSGSGIEADVSATISGGRARIVVGGGSIANYANSGLFYLS